MKCTANLFFIFLKMKWKVGVFLSDAPCYVPQTVQRKWPVNRKENKCAWLNRTSRESRGNVFLAGMLAG